MKPDKNKMPISVIVAVCIVMVAVILLFMRAAASLVAGDLTGWFPVDVAKGTGQGAAIEEKVDDAAQDVYGFEYEENTN